MRSSSPALFARRGLTVIELLVVIAIIGVMLGLLLPAVQRIRGAAARLECEDHLRQIGLGLHSFHGNEGRLPSGVSFRMGADPYPFMTWLTRILPYVEQSPLWLLSQQAYAQDKKFSDNPPHVGFATVMPLYSCPADGRAETVGSWQGLTVAFTDYLGVEGRNDYRRDGVLFLDSDVRLIDITDGTSNTLMVGERPPSTDGAFGWWYAGQGQDQTGAVDSVLGVRQRNSNSFPLQCPPGPYSFGPGDPNNQCDCLHFWSLHDGEGANFLFADGSVHFLSYSAAPLMPALATRRGGESVALPE